METVFDHNLTEDELDYLFVAIKTPEDYRNYKPTNDRVFSDLYRLFKIRGDVSKANTYLSQIQDPQSRFEISYRDRP